METLFEKLTGMNSLVWDKAVLTDSLTAEEVDFLVTSSPANPDKAVVMIDHDTPSGTVAVAAKQKKLRDFARANAIPYQYAPGISYHVLLESGIAEGEIVLSCGKRVFVVGASGAAGFAVSPKEMKNALETGRFTVPDAECVSYRFEGSFPDFVTAKDLSLEIIRDGSFSGRIVSIYAPHMSRGEKAAFLALIAGSNAVSVFFTSFSQEDATVIDLGGIERLAVLPDGYSSVVPASRLDGLRVSQVFIGGCAGGTIEALRAAAEVLRGKRVSKYVRVIVSPATAAVYNQAIEEGLVQVFLDSNAIVMNQGCSACWAQSQGRCDVNEVFATTGCINTANWAGKIHNGIYIVSPSDAARAALTGSLYEN